MPRYWASPLANRLVRALQAQGVIFELEVGNYGIVRDKTAVRLNISEGMDYSTWWLADISYPFEAVSPNIWDEDLHAFKPTSVRGNGTVTRLLKFRSSWEIHRRFQDIVIAA